MSGTTIPSIWATPLCTSALYKMPTLLRNSTVHITCGFLILLRLGSAYPPVDTGCMHTDVRRACKNNEGTQYGRGDFFIVNDINAVRSSSTEVPRAWARLCGVVEGFCESKEGTEWRSQVHSCLFVIPQQQCSRAHLLLLLNAVCIPSGRRVGVRG